MKEEEDLLHIHQTLMYRIYPKMECFNYMKKECSAHHAKTSERLIGIKARCGASTQKIYREGTYADGVV